MSEGTENEALQAARQRADVRLDAALASLRRAAAEIGREHGIPEGINGNSVEELLGRICYVPALSRDLRRAAGAALAQQEIAKVMQPKRGPAAPAAARPVVDPKTLEANIPKGLDLADLPGITAAMVKSLKAGGLNNVGDVVNVPDEHLAKIASLDAKNLGKLRAAIAKASVPAP